MNNYDDIILGIGNCLHPANQEDQVQTEILTISEFLEEELNKTYFKQFLSDFKLLVKEIYQTNKKIAKIEQNNATFGKLMFEEEVELQELKKKLTKLISLL